MMATLYPRWMFKKSMDVQEKVAAAEIESHKHSYIISNHILCNIDLS